jgi:hypothetical protein
MAQRAHLQETFKEEITILKQQLGSGSAGGGSSMVAKRVTFGVCEKTIRPKYLRRENRSQLVRRHHFELSVGAVSGRLIQAPSAELCHVPEAAALHMFICDFDHELRPQRLP